LMIIRSAISCRINFKIEYNYLKINAKIIDLFYR
jgi:hypothetical protein